MTAKSNVKRGKHKSLDMVFVEVVLHDHFIPKEKNESKDVGEFLDEKSGMLGNVSTTRKEQNLSSCLTSFCLEMYIDQNKHWHGGGGGQSPPGGGTIGPVIIYA